MKDDCITSCSRELQSCSLSKLYIDPIHRILVSVSTSSACTMQDVVWSNQAHADLCDPYSWDSKRKDYRLSSSLLEFCPPAINPEF